MEKIGVFCSAAGGLEPKFVEAAEQLGRWIGEQGKTLVYGGANCGLMNAVATEARRYGARIYGMVPGVLEERGMLFEDLDVIFPCQNLSDRKELLLQESDVLVALPGGVGTLDEVFTVMASHSIGYHSKLVVFYDVDGFWQPLFSFMEALDRQGFTRHPLSLYYRVVRSPEELAARLEEA